MTRSYRKTPILGITTSPSDKDGKRYHGSAATPKLLRK